MDAVTTHTDVSSTLLQLAGVTKQLDGTAMPLGQSSVTSYDDPKRHEHAAIEYWGYVSEYWILSFDSIVSLTA